jgi:hypothetical protein
VEWLKYAAYGLCAVWTLLIVAGTVAERVLARRENRRRQPVELHAWIDAHAPRAAGHPELAAVVLDVCADVLAMDRDRLHPEDRLCDRLPQLAPLDDVEGTIEEELHSRLRKEFGIDWRPSAETYGSVSRLLDDILNAADGKRGETA